MAARGDTREKVFQAADALLQEGKKPTQQTVRERIGSGSITTINSALNDWWQSLAQRFNRQSQHPELPDAVLSAANKLWDQALAYAHHSLEQERAELQTWQQEGRAAHQAQLEQLRATIDQMQVQNTQQHSELVQVQNQLFETRQALLDNEKQLIKALSERDELKRTNKQLELLGQQGQNDLFSSQASGSQQLFDVKVESQINKNKIKELESFLKEKDKKIQQLKAQLETQDKAAQQQIHRLELVIAQQDVRYEEQQAALKNCKKSLSLAQSS